jgi:uncharacterized protein (TIGR03437 family)
VGLLASATAGEAAPAGNGAQIWLTGGHTQCNTSDTIVNASGFAPNRGTAQVTITLKGGGPIFAFAIPLSGGAGSVNLGVPEDVPLGKYLFKFTAGKNVSGSYSATLVACG